MARPSANLRKTEYWWLLWHNNAGIAADPDTYELDEMEFAQLRRVGRPRAAVTKERIAIGLSPDVVQTFRATGDGWKTRVDAALRDWLKTHTPA